MTVLVPVIGPVTGSLLPTGSWFHYWFDSLFSYWSLIQLLILYYLLVPGSSYWFDSLFSHWSLIQLLVLYYLLAPDSSYWFDSLFSYWSLIQ